MATMPSRLAKSTPCPPPGRATSTGPIPVSSPSSAPSVPPWSTNSATPIPSGAITMPRPPRSSARTVSDSAGRTSSSKAPAWASAIKPHPPHTPAPAAITLFSPGEVRQLAPSLTALIPQTFRTVADVLSLPLENFIFGIGDINQPPAFQRSQADHDRLFHFYWQDTWKLHPNFAFNYGLAWSFESNALNHDLTKPQYLAPIFGTAGLGHEQHSYLRFTPAAGFAWSLPGNRTVIRGGGGIFYDTLNIETRLVERAYLGPLGTGYLPLPGSIIPNPIPGIPGLPY